MAPKQPLSDPERCAEAARTCACLHVRMAARAVTRLFDEALQAAGLRSTQFVLLAALRAEGPIALPRLAQALSMDRSSLTRALRPMQVSGWVLVDAGRTGRASQARLSAAGERLVTRALPLWEATQERLVATIAPASWEAIRAELDGITAAADRAMGGTLSG
jgi:DNA-binding MarR family transcriptional regulator